ncbi:NHL repeat-containing protein [Wilcoxina mikolae CBS 423.85]|nr:NHL repeat-containing protein [Wilcoxina mikolae CBS 423.85]
MNFLTASLIAVAAFFPASILASPARRQTVNVFEVPGNASYPDGVVFQPGTQEFYTASTGDGTVYRGSLSSKTMEPFLDGLPSGMVSPYGMKIIKDYLFIAGGSSGMLFQFSLSNRMLLRRFSSDDPDAFLYDMAVDDVTGDVYITDSKSPTVWKASGSNDPLVDQKLSKWVDLKGKVRYQTGSNSNGIVMTPDRKYLLMADRNDNALYRIGMGDRKVDKISITGKVTSPDGLLYDSPYLYSVNTEAVDVVKMDENFLKGEVVGKITNPLMFKSSTADFLPGKKELLVANFQEGEEKPKLPFTVVRIPVKW